MNKDRRESNERSKQTDKQMNEVIRCVCVREGTEEGTSILRRHSYVKAEVLMRQL
jgi:hypothetical protein